MRKARAWFVRVMGMFGKARGERELAAELESNLQLHVDDNIRAGMTPEEARRQAVIKLGGIESTKESYRERRNIPVIETLLQDIRFGLRMLRRNPGFALAVVLTLALGIGANVTMFSVVDALLFRMPEHVRAPEQLVRVSYGARPPLTGYRGQFPGFQTVLDNAKSLDMTLHMTAAQDFGRGADAKRVTVDFVSQNFFRMLGAEIQIGRPFAQDENQLDRAASVAILSYPFWQKQFGGDPHVIGRGFWIGERQYTVIGVAPRGFNGVNNSTISVWLPVADSPSGPEGFTDEKGTLRNQFLIMVGRLHSGVTPETAKAETDAIYLHSGADPQFAIRVAPLFPSRTAHLSDNARLSLWLAGVAFIVLLIACANVTNLFLVRMVRRRHEMAIRLQLGAGRGRLIGQVVVESLMLAVVGGVAAIVVTAWLNPLVRGFLLPPGFYAGEFLNYRVITMTAFFAVLAGITSGIAPAWRASRANLVEALKTGGPGQSNEKSSLRSGLLVAQVSLTLLLTIGAGLFIHSLRHIRALDLGFDPDHALTARVDLRKAGFQAADINSAYSAMMSRVREVSGVEAAGITSSIPLDTTTFTLIRIPADSSPTKPEGGSVFEAVTPGYFAALGMNIVEGRDFTPGDRLGSQPVIIVNQSFAQEVWPGRSAVWKCVLTIYNSQVCAEIVGVVRDAKPDLVTRPDGEKKEYYSPLDQSSHERPANTLVIRTSGKPSAAMRGILAALESVVPGSRYVNLQPLSLSLDEETTSWRLGASMFSFFGALALLLAAVGIYGVLAFLVRHRTSEIGIRMALGALPQDILRLIVWQGMKFVGIGLVIGIVAALGLSRVVRSLLFEVTPTDVWSYAGASGVLIVVALLACLVPAWRAARVDPSISLRYE